MDCIRESARSQVIHPAERHHLSRKVGPVLKKASLLSAYCGGAATTTTRDDTISSAHPRESFEADKFLLFPRLHGCAVCALFGKEGGPSDNDNDRENPCRIFRTFSPFKSLALDGGF